jgi:hypothetical protein
MLIGIILCYYDDQNMLSAVILTVVMLIDVYCNCVNVLMLTEAI